MIASGIQVPYEVSWAVSHDRPIEAIKELRIQSGMTLPEAKRFIENNWISLGGNPSSSLNKEFTKPTENEAPMAPSDAPLPKQELLLKMLNMTTADNDGQALVAIRKANALLASAGWTWEKLLLGKIVVVADPFANIKSPDSNKKFAGSAPPPQTPRAAKTLGQKANIYPGFCYNCGTHVPSGDGFVFNPSQHTSGALDKWVITCSTDNTKILFVARTPAPKKNSSWTATPSPTGPAPKLGDL